VCVLSEGSIVGGLGGICGAQMGSTGQGGRTKMLDLRFTGGEKKGKKDTSVADMRGLDTTKKKKKKPQHKKTSTQRKIQWGEQNQFSQPEKGGSVGG